MAKRTLSITGPSPKELAGGQVVPSVHQILSDARVMLSDEMANIAALRQMDRIDVEQSSKLTKNSHARADGLLKLLKAAQLLRLETAAASREAVAGQDLSKMTTEQLLQLVQAQSDGAAQRDAERPDAAAQEDLDEGP